MFFSGDQIEALERMDTDAGHFEPGDRRTVNHVSASGAFIQLVGADAFIRAHGWRRVKRAEAA